MTKTVLASTFTQANGFKFPFVIIVMVMEMFIDSHDDLLQNHMVASQCSRIIMTLYRLGIKICMGCELSN